MIDVLLRHAMRTNHHAMQEEIHVLLTMLGQTLEPSTGGESARKRALLTAVCTQGRHGTRRWRRWHWSAAGMCMSTRHPRLVCKLSLHAVAPERPFARLLEQLTTAGDGGSCRHVPPKSRSQLRRVISSAARFSQVVGRVILMTTVRRA